MQVFLLNSSRIVHFETKNPALGIGRATVFGTNAELVTPCKVGRSQGVCAAGTAKGCSHPPEVVAATGR